MAEIKVFGLTIDPETITDRQKLVFGAAVAVIALAVGAHFNKPTYDSYQELLVEVERLSADRDIKAAQVAKLPALRVEFEALQANLRTLEAKIPRKENIPSLLLDMERLTDTNEVILQSFIPGALAAVQLPANVAGDSAATQNLQNRLRQLPVRITSAGGYPDMINLFGNVERYERTLAADSVSLSPTQGKTNSGFRQLQVSFNLNAYVLLGGQ